MFIRLHAVAPERYGWFFGAAAMGVIGFGQLSAPLAERLGRPRLFGLALGVLAAAGAMVALAALLGLGFWPLYGALLLYTAALGAILPLGTVLAIQPHGQMAGTASALIGTVQFGPGAVLGAALSLLHDGTALPMAGLIGLAGVLALLSWRRLARVT